MEKIRAHRKLLRHVNPRLTFNPLFRSRFEEKKIYEYLSNTIRSAFVTHKPHGVLGNLHFFNKLLKSMITEDLDISPDQMGQLKNILNLTPGDFAVVREQFRFVDPLSVSHQRLIDALNAEAIRKSAKAKPVGFRSRVC